MRTEQDFFNELGRTPEAPPHLYSSIRSRVRRRASLTRSLFAVAATLVVALGAGGFRTFVSGSGDRVSSDVAAELQTVREYCNGDDLSNELETYVLYESDNTAIR